MNFLKLVIKNSFYVQHLKESEMLIKFVSGVMVGVDVLDLPLKKVLVSKWQLLLGWREIFSLRVAVLT